jgi:2-aminoethylphosphonate-pyruvate transaminase
MIRRAILLAAGRGRQTNGHDVPAPLTVVGGVTLIKRTLAALEQHGVHDTVIVLGHRGEEIRRHVSSDPDITSRIIWVDNPDWDLPDLSSLLRARAYVDEAALLLGSDLIFAPEMLAVAVDRDELPASLTLLVDRKLHRIYDLSTAVKVQTRGARVVEVGPELAQFDAVDIGIRVLQPEVLDRLEEVQGQDQGLLALLQHAARDGQLGALDVNGSQWQQIASPETRLHAEWLLRALGDDLSGHEPARNLRTATDPQRTLSYIEGLLSEKSARHYVLFNPGPVLTSPRVKSALVHHDVCHRDSDYSAVVRRLQRKLRRVCRGGPEHDIVLLSGSGTAAMEATVSSCISKEGKLLVVSNGAFGERFAEIAEVHGIRTVHVRHAWGELLEPREVAQALDADPEIEAVAMCHHETSVGILNPVHEIGSVCRKRDRMFLVDAVSSLGGEDLDVRRDKIDVLISSANKCLHAISGVSFVCISNRIWPRIEEIAPRVYYLSLKRYRLISQTLSQTPFTPAVSNFFALDAALDELLHEGLVHRIRHYRTINRRIRKALRQLGLVQLTDTGHEAHTITTVQVPPYITFAELYSELKGRGYIIYACREHLRDNYFQIANMGELSDEMIQGFLDTLGLVLHQAALLRRGLGDVERARIEC